MDQDVFFPPTEDSVKDVKLVLVRVKNSRFSFLRVSSRVCLLLNNLLHFKSMEREEKWISVLLLFCIRSVFRGVPPVFCEKKKRETMEKNAGEKEDNCSRSSEVHLSF